MWLAWCLLVGGCASPDQGVETADDGEEVDEGPAQPDVVLVTLDTCRADRLGVYGYEDAATPALDALAARGRRYARAYSPVPLTIPAHSALFTGRGPASLGIATNGGGLPLDEATLAEEMRAAGYATVASVGAWVTSRIWGFGQGFDAYFETDEGQPARPGDQVVDDILAWRASAPADAPHFAWVHLYDAHEPYPADARGGDPYDAGVRALDAQVGRLVEHFSDRPTVFVVVGDHGEGLGEHGERFHGLYVYESTQRVPWLIAGPGIDESVVDEPVSLIDVAPTLLDLLGLPSLDRAEGRVAPGTLAQPVQLEARMLELRFGLAPHRGVVDGDYKLIDVPEPELYDLSSDPSEENDLAQSHPDLVARLRALLPEPGGPLRDTSIEPMLAALGYQHVEPVEAEGPLEDAKHHQPLVTAVERADALAESGDVDGALSLLGEIRTEHPDVRELIVREGQLLAASGRHHEAVARLQEAAERDPESAIVARELAAVLEAAGQPEEAAEALEELARAHPHLPGVYERAMSAWMQTPSGSPRALRLGLERLEASPEDLRVAGLVGVILARSGDLVGSRDYLIRGARAQPPARDVLLVLARFADMAGDQKRARELIEAEVAAYPDNAAALLALAWFLGRSGERDAQRRLIDDVLARGAETGIDLRPFQALRAGRTP